MGAVFPVVLIGRLIQGIGTGLILPLMFSVAMQIFPPYKLGDSHGDGCFGDYVCACYWPNDYRAGACQIHLALHFWLFVPFLVLAFIFTLTSMENVYHQTQTPVDWLSIVESSIGFAGIVVGTTMASDAGWLSLEVGLALLVGVIGLVLYARRQLSLTNPMLNLRVFANKQFTVGTLLVMLDFGVILASMYLLPMYLQRVMGLPVAMTGLVMLPGGIVNAAVSAIAGRMYDSHGAKWLSRGGFVIAILGVLILLNSGAQSPLWWIILGHVVLMIGAPLAMSPAQTYGLNSLSGAESADGSALLNTLQQIVGAVSTAVATSMLALGSAKAAGQTGLTIGSHFGFMFVLI